MKYQPNRDYMSDDVVMTPVELARKLIQHFNPQGKGLEPCRGTGNIWSQLKNADWCEITDGRDFYEWKTPVDYIFTNPPWSQIRKFLQHSYTVANVAQLYSLYLLLKDETNNELMKELQHQNTDYFEKIVKDLDLIKEKLGIIEKNSQ